MRQLWYVTSKKLRRPTYSEVVATLALFIALGGASYAAIQVPKNSVGANQLKKNAVTSKKVKNGSLLAKDFKKGQLPRGATGPQGNPGEVGPIGPTGTVGAPGPAGENGATGADGATGATGADGIQGEQGPTGADGAIGPTGPTGDTGPSGASSTAVAMGRVALTSSLNEYASPFGASNPAGSVAAVSMISPPVAVKASSFVASLTVPPGSSSRRQIELMDDGSVILYCSFLGESTLCQDLGSAVVQPRSELVIHSFGFGSPPPATDLKFSYTLGP